MVTLYTIHADGTPGYLPKDLWGDSYISENVTPTSARLVTEDNKSGTLTFSILPDNLAYDKITLICSTIKVTEHVYDDCGSEVSDKIIWMGRPISIEEDMEHVRSYVCEGALAYLNDIICYPLDATITSEVVVPDETNGIVTATDMKNEAIKRALQTFLDTGGNSDSYLNDSGNLFEIASITTIDFKDCIYTVGRGYNSECPSNRKIKIGNVTIANMSGITGLYDATSGTDPLYSPSDYPNGAWYFEMALPTPDIAFASALDQILYVTTETNGGHLVMRYEIENNDIVMYLDYLSDYTWTNSSAEYGVNIIDYSGSLEMNSPVTDIIPRGAVISTWTDNNAMANDITNIDNTYNIGDTVSFKGTRHYVASTSDVGYPCTPGRARITNIALGTKHPYHLIHNDDQSTVYGWVNQTDVETGYVPPKPSTEFTRRSYDSMPGTEYVGIRGGYHGGVHLVNEELMAKYGRIQQIVDFPDIKTPIELKAAGEEWLRTHSSFLRQSYEISMIDLGRIYGKDMQPIHLLDLVHISIPGYVDEYMPITKIDLDLTNPANTTFQFSKVEETATISKSKRRKARAAVSDSALSVQFNGPGDSLTESMASNNRYLSKLNNHTDINTSVSKNTKNTFPGGQTGSFNLQRLTRVDADGTEHYVTQKLTFVNGLLCSTDGMVGGPEINYLSLSGLTSGLYPRMMPVNKSAILYNSGTGLLTSGLLNVHSSYALFAYSYTYVNGNGHNDEINPSYNVKYMNNSEAENLAVIPHPYLSDPEEEILTLEVNPESPYYGLYYYTFKHVGKNRKVYWPTPCIYYLPTTFSEYLYIFYARPESENETETDSVTGEPIAYSIYTQKIANLGWVSKYHQMRYSANYILGNIYDEKFIPRCENALKKALLSYQPSNTYEKLVTMGGESRSSSPPPMTALLIMPFYDVDQTNYRGLYVSPALVEPSADTEYIYMYHCSYPKTMKIYAAAGDQSTTPWSLHWGFPLSYYKSNVTYPRRDLNIASDESNVIPAMTADMTLDFKGYFKSEIATDIKNAECYVFTSQEDLDAIVEDYKNGGLSQGEIYMKHFGKAISLNSREKNVSLSYKFNGISTGYKVSGSSYGDPLSPI